MGVARNWGTFGRFRNEYGIEKPPSGGAHKNTIIALKICREESIAKKMIKKKELISFIKKSKEVDVAMTINIFGLTSATAITYLKELISSNILQRRKSGKKFLYRIIE